MQVARSFPGQRFGEYNSYPSQLDKSFGIMQTVLILCITVVTHPYHTGYNACVRTSVQGVGSMTRATIEVAHLV